MAKETVCWVVNNYRAIKVTVRDGMPWVREYSPTGMDIGYTKMLTSASTGPKKGYLLLSSEDQVVSVHGQMVAFTPTVPIIGEVVIG